MLRFTPDSAHRLGFVRLSVRPRHPSSDPQAQEVFKKASLSW
jgi:hypothetical protein